MNAADIGDIYCKTTQEFRNSWFKAFRFKHDKYSQSVY